MKTTLKKGLSLLLATSLMLSMSAFAFASDAKENTKVSTLISVSEEKTEITAASENLPEGSYIVKGNITPEKDLLLAGNSKIEIAPSASLTIDTGKKLKAGTKLSISINKDGKLIIKGEAANIALVENKGSLSIIKGKITSDNAGTFINEGNLELTDAGLNWKGLLINEGTVSGNTKLTVLDGGSYLGKLDDKVAFEGSFTVPKHEKYSFTVPEGKKLSIPRGKTVTVAGNVENEGSIEGDGIIKFNDNAGLSGFLPRNASFARFFKIPAGKMFTLRPDEKLSVSIHVSGTLMNEGVAEKKIMFSEGSSLCGILPDDMAVEGNISVPSDKTLKIAERQHLIIPEGKVLTVNGNLENNGSVEGKVKFKENSSLCGNLPKNSEGGFKVNEGKSLLVPEGVSSSYPMSVAGTIINRGELEGKITLSDGAFLAGKLPSYLEVKGNFSVPNEKTLTVGKTETLTVPEKSTLTVNGELDNLGTVKGNVKFSDGSSLSGNLPEAHSFEGTISVPSQKTLTIPEKTEVSKDIKVYGELINNGTLTGNILLADGAKVSGNIPDSFVIEHKAEIPEGKILRVNKFSLADKQILALNGTLEITENGSFQNAGKITGTGKIVFEDKTAASGLIPKEAKTEIKGKLTVPKENTLTIENELLVNEKNKVSVLGTLEIAGDGKLKNLGTIEGEGNVSFKSGSLVSGNMPISFTMENILTVPKDEVLKLSHSLVIPEEKEIKLDGDMVVAENVTLTNKGSITGEGKLIFEKSSSLEGNLPHNAHKDGTIFVSKDDTLTVKSEEEVSNDVVVEGKLINNGKITGLVTFRDGSSVSGKLPENSKIEASLRVPENESLKVTNSLALEDKNTLELAGNLDILTGAEFKNHGKITGEGTVAFRDGAKLGGNMPKNHKIEKSVAIANGETLTIPEGVTVTNNLSLTGKVVNKGNFEGKLMLRDGSSISGKLPENLAIEGTVTVPSDEALDIPDGGILKIPAASELKAAGKLNTVEGSYIQTEKSEKDLGVLTVTDSFVNKGIIANEGIISGTFTNEGKVYNLGSLGKVLGKKPYVMVDNLSGKRLMKGDISDDSVSGKSAEAVKKELKNALLDKKVISDKIDLSELILIDKKDGVWAEIHEPVTLKLPYPDGLNKNSKNSIYVAHMDTKGKIEVIEADKKSENIAVKLSGLSPVAVGYTSYTAPSTSGGHKTPHITLNNKFWDEITEQIKALKKGDVIKADAGSYDQMPFMTMEALREKKVSMVVDYDEGSFVIPAGKALKDDANKIYYNLEDLHEKFKYAKLEDAVLEEVSSPEVVAPKPETKPLPKPVTPAPKPEAKPIPSEAPEVSKPESSEESTEESKEEVKEEESEPADAPEEAPEKSGFPLWVIFLVLGLLTGGAAIYFFIRSRME